MNDLSSELEALVEVSEVAPSFNIAPTSSIPVIGVRDGKRLVRLMEWGLIPKWSKDASRQSSMINARVETVTERSSFKSLVGSNRVVVPITGFYEWDRSGTSKIPYFFTRKDSRIMCVAGLWTSWIDPSTSLKRNTIAMLTTEANSDLGGIHDRMPSVLDNDGIAVWLDGNQPLRTPLSLAANVSSGQLAMRRVGQRVNSVKNNDADLLLEVAAD